MTLRSRLAVTLTALVVVAGCGSDTPAANADTTTTLSDPLEIGETPTSTPDTAPSTTVSDNDFSAAIAPLQAQIGEAQDLCSILTMLNSTGNLPNPTGPAQIKEAVELTADLFSAIGGQIADDEPEAAVTIKAASNKLREEAAAAGYTDAILNDNVAFSDPAFTAAMDTATTVAQNRCPTQ